MIIIKFPFIGKELRTFDRIKAPQRGGSIIVALVTLWKKLYKRVGSVSRRPEKFKSRRWRRKQTRVQKNDKNVQTQYGNHTKLWFSLWLLL
jgi:hypothetical protein